jgi:hypothetical protein
MLGICAPDPCDVAFIFQPYLTLRSHKSSNSESLNRYRMQIPSLLTVVAFVGALASVVVLAALPPAFGTDDVLIQVQLDE